MVERSQQLAKRQQDPHQEKKKPSKSHSKAITAFTGWDGSVVIMPPSGTG